METRIDVNWKSTVNYARPATQLAIFLEKNK